LIGLRVLPEISRNEYEWLGFGGRERGRRRGAVGAVGAHAGKRRGG
jgi:hypothetical protein